jgi:hypothetical protein
MPGYAHISGMRYALAIKDNHIRFISQGSKTFF